MKKIFVAAIFVASILNISLVYAEKVHIGGPGVDKIQIDGRPGVAGDYNIETNTPIKLLRPSELPPTSRDYCPPTFTFLKMDENGGLYLEPGGGYIFFASI